MQSIDIYLGYLIFGLIFNHYKRENEIEGNELKLLDEKAKEFDEFLKKMTTVRNNFIVNKPGRITKNLRKKFFLACLSFVAHIEIKKVLYIKGFQFFNFLPFYFFTFIKSNTRTTKYPREPAFAVLQFRS